MVIFSLTLVRHGETAHNKEKIIQGQLDVPLSAVGEGQVELLGINLQNQKYTHIYSSDLKRAKRTAEIIVKNNMHFKGTIIEDQRLRERKFGEVEGKPFKYLKEQTQEAVLPNFTPKGAETVEEVNMRTLDFFHDLCNNLREQSLNSSHDSSNQNVSELFENTDKNSNTKDSRQGKRKRLNSSIDSTDEVETEDLKSNKNGTTRPSPSKSELKEAGALNCHPKAINNSGLTYEECILRSSIKVGLNSSPPANALSPLADQLNHQEIGERRLSICSSNDELDATPQLSANILVVGHGGSLRELIRHFVEELNCPIPGGKRQALRISPNSGLSKFTFTLDDSDDKPKIICHQIHDKQHLELSQRYRKPSPQN